MDVNERFVLTKPVEGGYVWWSIVRQTQKGGTDWFPDPDFSLMRISSEFPDAEQHARSIIAGLGGLIQGETCF